MVTKLNEILSRIADGTSNQPGIASVLQGNSSARRVADWLRNAVIAPVDATNLTSVGMAGIELTSDGKLTFNKDKFSEALLSDASTLTALFIDRDGTGDLGVLGRLIDAADAAASYGDGALYTAAESAERRADDYAKQIDAIQERLEIRESTLRRTFANLEVALAGLQSQSAYLAAQLSSLGGT